jgi:hypothetical protein
MEQTVDPTALFRLRALFYVTHPRGGSLVLAATSSAQSFERHGHTRGEEPSKRPSYAAIVGPEGGREGSGIWTAWPEAIHALVPPSTF